MEDCLSFDEVNVGLDRPQLHKEGPRSREERRFTAAQEVAYQQHQHSWEELLRRASKPVLRSWLGWWTCDCASGPATRDGTRMSRTAGALFIAEIARRMWALQVATFAYQDQYKQHRGSLPKPFRWRYFTHARFRLA